MPASISLSEIQTNLRELITRLAPGEEVAITDNQRVVAKLVGQAAPAVNCQGNRQHGGFPQLGTPEWDSMNERRSSLLQKRVQGALTNEEQAELEELQRHSHEAMERAFPRPRLTPEERELVERTLGLKPENGR